MLGTTQSKVGTRINSSVISTLYLFSFFKHEASFKQYLETRTHSQFTSFLRSREMNSKLIKKNKTVDHYHPHSK